LHLFNFSGSIELVAEKQRKGEEKMYDTEKLKARVIEKYGTQKAFAIALGVDESTVSRCLNEGREWKGSNLIKAVNILGIPKKDIDSYFFTPRVAENQQSEGI